MRVRGIGWGIVLLLAMAWGGCTSSNTEEIGEERTGGEGTSETEATTQEAAVEPITSAHGLAWDVPDRFRPVTPSSSMRVAEYELPAEDPDVKPAELALFFFGPGIGGGTQANLERWAAQFRQPDGSDAMERATLETFTTDSGLEVSTIALTGIYEPSTMSSAPSFDHPGWALYGAVVEGEGGPWFFKAVGPEAVIEAHRGALEGLYRSVRLSS
ncbi:MAG: hypothetical protein GF346_00825 [Candidatus Eisenbacteria bacterium]|nr:hypothetical protein [Candidatus Latescibacterota bacterium]MBD3300975.1 hypothetical protein [Candidatus Eisenbacteria bacterium]